MAWTQMDALRLGGQRNRTNNLSFVFWTSGQDGHVCEPIEDRDELVIAAS